MKASALKNLQTVNETARELEEMKEREKGSQPTLIGIIHQASISILSPVKYTMIATWPPADVRIHKTGKSNEGDKVMP